MRSDELTTMIADYMEKGFLENIIDMFKHDRSLFSSLGALMADKRGRVRLGAVALVEDMAVDYAQEIARIIPDIAALLKDKDPVIRADAAHMLGISRNRLALQYLREVEDDKNPLVREVVVDSIKELIGL